MKPKSIGIFGAAFDPPTLGHYDALEQALPHFDKILLVPSAAHPFGKQMAPWLHRLNMLKLFKAHWPKDTPIDIDPIEQSLRTQAQPVYTYDVLCHLQEKWPDDRLIFIIGPDNSKQFHNFYQHDAIISQWGIFEVNQRKTIRSITVRNYIQEKGQAVEEKTLIQWVPKSIAQYIIENHVYFQKQ